MGVGIGARGSRLAQDIRFGLELGLESPYQLPQWHYPGTILVHAFSPTLSILTKGILTQRHTPRNLSEFMARFWARNILFPKPENPTHDCGRVTSISRLFFIFNPSSTTALLYPPVGGNINGATTDAAFSLAQNKAAIFWHYSPLLYRVVLTA